MVSSIGPKGVSMLTQGKMDITIKINTFPENIEEIDNGWKQFTLECGEHKVSVTLRPKHFNKMVKATDAYPEWVAAFQGQMGELTEKGFVLLQPGVQVFERKPKKPKEPKE